MTSDPSSRATLALVLGLAATVCLLGFFTGLPAAILGRLELTAIDEGRAPESGRLRATIGMALGLCGTVVSCLGCGIYITAAVMELAK